ncbi:hypothetical protein AND_004450 [Anopheles darlingi]|uniref:Uncharacterized protein n=1 Tax=Anopheles darlingi TaxID=43151 RepID=W5JM16_ANODA|nr:hypothetical protein AND_004450 [Anopheles darlingi]
MLPEIQVLIKKLIAAGADFNICSLQLKLPFQLLLKYRPTDEATSRFVDQCVQQAGQALVIGRINDSKMRVVEIYKSPMQSPEESPVKVTEELLEICLHYNDQQSFVNYLTGFKITKHNVKKVIEVVLHTAVEKKMSECLRKIVDLGGALIFEEIRQTKQNTEVTLSVHRLELKGLLKKACLAADLSIVKILIANMKDLQLLNDDPLLALTLTNAYAIKRRSENREALLAVAVKQQPHNYGNVQTELTIIRQIAESNDLKRLLIHPIIYTFIMVKWIRLSPWMYLNFLLTFTTMLVFGLHSLDACSVDTSPSQPLWIGALLGTLYIVIREILQLVILRTAYATFENVMDLANIVGMIFVLLKGCHGPVDNHVHVQDGIAELP